LFHNNPRYTSNADKFSSEYHLLLKNDAPYSSTELFFETLIEKLNNSEIPFPVEALQKNPANYHRRSPHKFYKPINRNTG